MQFKTMAGFPRFGVGRSLAIYALPAVFIVASLAHPQRECAADEYDRAPISYSNKETSNAVSRLQERLEARQAKLEYEDHFGYLRSLLRVLDVPESSQMLVFSKTSLQSRRIWAT